MAIKAIAKWADERDVSFLTSKAYIVPARPAVIKALSRIASLQSVGIFIEALQEGEDQDVIKSAQSGLLQIGKPAIPALERVLKNIGENRNQQFRVRIQKLIRQINQ